MDLAMLVNEFKNVTNSQDGAKQLSEKELKGELEGEKGFMNYWRRD